MSNIVSHTLRLIDQVTRPARAMGQAVRDVNRAISQNSKGLKNWGQNAVVAGGLLGAAAIGINSQLAKPIAASTDFNAAMSSVAAITRSTAPEMAALSKRAKELGASTSFSAIQVASAQKFLGVAGFNANQILKGLPATLNLARAGALDLGQAADIASDIMTGFGLEAESLTDITDVLAATFTRSNTSLPQLYEAMKIGAPIAKTAGLSIREAAVAMGVLADAGLKGSVGGTGFSAAISRLSSPTGEASGALSVLGVKATDSLHNLRPLPDVFKEIKAGLEGFGKADQIRLLTEIFGQEHAKAAANFADAAASGKWQKALADMKEVGGVAKDIAEIMGDNLEGDLIELNSATEGLFITIGDSLEPVLRLLVQAVTPVIQAINTLASEFPILTGLVSGTAITLGGLLAVTASVTLALGIGASALGQMSEGYAIISKHASKFSFLLRPLAPLLNLVAVGIRAIGVAFASTGVGLILIAIAAAALLIYKYWEPIKAFFAGVFAGISEALAPVFEVFSALAPVFDPITSGIGELFTWIGNLIAPVEGVGDAAESLGVRFGRVIGEAIKSFILWPLKIVGVGSKIVSTIAGEMAALASKPAEVMAGIVGKVREYLPFSPAKVGPLRDLNRIKLTQTVAESMTPAPMVKAMKAATAATGAVLVAGATPFAPVAASVPVLTPPPSSVQNSAQTAQGGLVIKIEDNRNITLNLNGGGNSEAIREAVLAALRDDQEELVERVRAQLAFEGRSDF